jgi:hypothetical protein
VCLIRFRWLHYCPNARQSDAAVAEAQSDARGYRFEPAEKTVIFPASAVLTRKETLAAVQKLVRVGGAGGYLPLHTAQ